MCSIGTISAAQTFDNYNRIQHIVETYLLRHFGSGDQPLSEQTIRTQYSPLGVE